MSQSQVGPSPLKAADPVITKADALTRAPRLAPGALVLNTVNHAIEQVAHNVLGGFAARYEIGFFPSTNGKTPKNPVTIIPAGKDAKQNGSVRVTVAHGRDLQGAAEKLAIRLLRTVLYQYDGGKASKEDETRAAECVRGIITSEVIKSADMVIRHAEEKAKAAAMVRLSLAGTPFNCRVLKSAPGEASYLWLRQLVAANTAAQAGDPTALVSMLSLMSGINVQDGNTKKDVPAPTAWKDVLELAIPSTPESVPVPEAKAN